MSSCVLWIVFSQRIIRCFLKIFEVLLRRFVFRWIGSIRRHVPWHVDTRSVRINRSRLRSSSWSIRRHGDSFRIISRCDIHWIARLSWSSVTAVRAGTDSDIAAILISRQPRRSCILILISSTHLLLLRHTVSEIGCGSWSGRRLVLLIILRRRSARARSLRHFAALVAELWFLARASTNHAAHLITGLLDTAAFFDVSTFSNRSDKRPSRPILWLIGDRRRLLYA